MEFSKAQISDVIKQALVENEPVMYLDSQLSGHSSSIKSYLAYGEEAYIKVYADTIEIGREGVISKTIGSPWEALKDFRNEFSSWLFGYLGYDLKNYVENLASENADHIGLPDLYFFIPKVIIEICEDDAGIKIIKGEVNLDPFMDLEYTPINLHLVKRIDTEQYLEKIEEAKSHIKEGDFYEINISHQMRYSFKGNSFDLYNAMKGVGPVPFGAYLNFDKVAVCCASPERFLSKKGNRVVSQPIKGTLARDVEDGKEGASDILKNSQKDRAENLMIVDLVRNDIGRVAKKGTVEALRLFEIQEFETVFQMVSTVEGELEEGISIIDVIGACFPMGSMTGAPKIRAMEIIERLEDYKRCLYSGAIGYINPEDDFDFNVVIRTAIVKGEDLFYSVGGAITSDSDPLAEWEETLVKTKALEKAVEQI